MTARCPRCKGLVVAVRDAAGKVILLPHAPGGGERVWPEGCGVRR